MSNQMKTWQHVAYLGNENAAALATGVLCEKFPNVTFEGIEVGDGSYNIKVCPKYSDGPIDDSVIDMFKTTLFEVYGIVATVVRLQKQAGG